MRAGHRGTGAQGHRTVPRFHGSTVPRNKKGWLRIIEIALAATLVFAFFIFVNNFEGKSRSSRPETDRYTLSQIGEDAIRSYDLLDANGDSVSDLRTEVLTSDWATISTQLNTTLGENIGYMLYFYNDTGGYSQENVQFVSGARKTPVNRDIVSVYYIISGGDGSYCSSSTACALKLDLWHIK